jgi:F-type H+-transporting ATPase subunit c
MNKKKLFVRASVLALCIALCLALATVAFAAGTDTAAEAVSAVAAEAKTLSTKAIAAAAVVAVVAAAGAIGMAISIRKSVESMARQPEAADKINSAMMLGLVFIETTIIYALIVAVLIIFVL